MTKSLLFTLCSLLLIVGCKDKKRDDPQPTTFDMAVRYSAVGVRGLGALVEIKNQRNYGAVTTFATAQPDSSASQTWQMGAYDIGGSVQVDMTFRSVTRTSGVIIPPSARLIAEILVNGQVRSRDSLTSTSGSYTFIINPTTVAYGKQVAVELDNP